jgi:hypothetical protein
MLIFHIYLIFCKKKMKHSMTIKYLATMDAETIGQKRLSWHPQLHPSPSAVMIKLNLEPYIRN